MSEQMKKYNYINIKQKESNTNQRKLCPILLSHKVDFKAKVLTIKRNNK